MTSLPLCAHSSVLNDKDVPIDFESLPCLDEIDLQASVSWLEGGQALPKAFRLKNQEKGGVSSGKPGRAPRLLDRLAPSKQSLGRLNIRRLNESRSIRPVKDLFHTLVNMGTIKLILIVITWVVLSWIVFAIGFRLLSRSCGLKANTFLEALYLAVETVETIGYGVPDSYFNGCRSGIFVIGFGALWESVMNALLMSVVYTRISRRGQSRASSICFSDKAVICKIGKHCYFMFQVCDLRKHVLLEAHARLYSIQHSDDASGVPFQTREMRLQHPDDELGGMLLLVLPQLVVHRIDVWSPFWPYEQNLHSCSAASGFHFPDTPQRAVDAVNGNRDLGPFGKAEAQAQLTTLEEIAIHLKRQQLEVMCLLEGIDPSTSMTLQARHSYAWDDLVFNATFQRCISRASDGACEIDLNAFHEIIGLQEGTLPIQSMA